MSDLYNRINDMCKERGTNITALCKAAGVGRATLSELNAGRSKTLTLSTAQKLADVLRVPVDELMGKEKAPDPLNRRDERDIEKRLEALLGDLEGPEAAGLMFSGEPMDEDTRELLRISLRNQLELSKRIAKQKYTPNKYKEGE